MKWSRLGYLSGIALGAAVLAQLATVLGGLTGVRNLELLTFDLRQRTASEQPKLSDDGTEIVIVFFDELSVADWSYYSPYPRDNLASLIEVISSAGARTIGLDVYLDRLGPDSVAAARLRNAIADAGNVILVAPTLVEDNEPLLAPPDPYFADVAADVASADFPTPFETIRDGSLAVRSGRDLEPSFALALWAHSRGIDVDSLLAVALERGAIELEGLPDGVGGIPDHWWTEEDDGGFAIPFQIRFIGPPSHHTDSESLGTFTAASEISAEVLPVFQPDYFRDKIVLLGTGFHDSDKFRTPFYGVSHASVSRAGAPPDDPEGVYDWMFGVEIHAHALQNLIDGEMLKPMSAGGTWALLFAFGLLGSVFVFWNGAVAGAVASVLLSGSLYLGAMTIFAGGVGPVPTYLSIPIVPTLLALWLGYLGSTAYVSIVEGREKRFIRGAFSKYVPADVVGEIADNHQVLRLGGQKREITVFFSDLAGFTEMSERMGPEELVAHLNEYLTVMTQVVMDERGTLDKYVGDMIMAFWNAPTEMEDHADRALRCAIHTQRKMHELNERWTEADPDVEPLEVRIGINSGEVVVGNVGGENRFDYSAIGDPVNLGARLEPANKTYNTLTMVSEFTRTASREQDYRWRELDLIAVKGKAEPVRVYELVEFAGTALAPHVEEALAHYDSGMAAYKNRDWLLASKYFEAALAAHPTDGPSAVYLGRSQENIANPPPADWDFVVRRTAK